VSDARVRELRGALLNALREGDIEQFTELLNPDILVGSGFETDFEAQEALDWLRWEILEDIHYESTDFGQAFSALDSAKRSRVIRALLGVVAVKVDAHTLHLFHGELKYLLRESGLEAVLATVEDSGVLRFGEDYAKTLEVVASWLEDYSVPEEVVESGWQFIFGELLQPFRMSWRFPMYAYSDAGICSVVFAPFGRLMRIATRRGWVGRVVALVKKAGKVFELLGLSDEGLVEALDAVFALDSWEWIWTNASSENELKTWVAFVHQLSLLVRGRTGSHLENYLEHQFDNWLWSVVGGSWDVAPPSLRHVALWDGVIDYGVLEKAPEYALFVLNPSVEGAMQFFGHSPEVLGAVFSLLLRVAEVEETDGGLGVVEEIRGKLTPEQWRELRRALDLYPQLLPLFDYGEQVAL